MSDRAEAGHVPPWILVVLVLLVLALIWCLLSKPKSTPESTGYRPTPPAPFTANVDSVDRDTILAYGDSLEFDTTAGAGDEQRLMVGDTCPPAAAMMIRTPPSRGIRDGSGGPGLATATVAPAAPRGTAYVLASTACSYGPRARIQPELGSYAIADTADLASGRIVARIVTADSVYAKLGLRGGYTTYWWVDKKGPGNTWRSVLVPSYPSDTLVHRSLILHRADSSGTYRWLQAIARFEWHDSDESLWSTCTNGYCCKEQ